MASSNAVFTEKVFLQLILKVLREPSENKASILFSHMYTAI